MKINDSCMIIYLSSSVYPYVCVYQYIEMTDRWTIYNINAFSSITLLERHFHCNLTVLCSSSYRLTPNGIAYVDTLDSMIFFSSSLIKPQLNEICDTLRPARPIPNCISNCCKREKILSSTQFHSQAYKYFNSIGKHHDGFGNNQRGVEFTEHPPINCSAGLAYGRAVYDRRHYMRYKI